MSKGRLIVIEGTDGSGKATQSELLYRRLSEKYGDVRKVEYPDYGSESSGPVKMYLRGDFGAHADDVSPYAASALFAVDRFASYAGNWKAFYQDGGIVVADRYTTANMVHQAAKITDQAALRLFLEWLRDLEFGKLGLPEPDLVFFLDVPPDTSEKLLRKREAEMSESADIHEADRGHLEAAYRSAHWVAERFGWKVIKCSDDEGLRPAQDIHEEIYQKVKEFLSK